MPKQYHRDASTFIPLAVGFGSCIATDRITVDGEKVGYMYREAPSDSVDSGWRFFAGDEDQQYVDNASNLAMYDVNTIANYDPVVVQFLDSPWGQAFVRVGASFKRDELGVNPLRLE